MTRRFALAAALIGGIALAVSLARGLPRGAAAPQARSAAPAPAAAAASPAPVDPGTLRDVFRFADERETGAGPAVFAQGEGPSPPPARILPTPPPGPRLVGLVRRGGRVLAAIAFEGEVELAGAGEEAAGVLVLSLDESGARVRRRDGGEERLELE